MLHEGDVANPVDRTLEYSRPLRSLRLWMAFRVHGAAQYRAWIERTLANARALSEAVDAAPEFELLHEPMLSTVCFRHVPPGVERPRRPQPRARQCDATRRSGLSGAGLRRWPGLPAGLLRELPDDAGRGRARARRGGRARGALGPGLTTAGGRKAPKQRVSGPGGAQGAGGASERAGPPARAIQRDSRASDNADAGRWPTRAPRWVDPFGAFASAQQPGGRLLDFQRIGGRDGGGVHLG